MENRRAIERAFLEEVSINNVELPISTLEDMVIRLKEVGATHFSIYASKDWDDNIEDYEITFTKLEIESEEVYLKRETEEKLRLQKLAYERALRIENEEKETLRKLKAKYEN